MSTPFYILYQIGGSIALDDIISLAEALQADGLSLDNTNHTEASEIFADIYDCITEKASLCISGADIYGAETLHTDAFCQKHGLTFIKQVDGKDGYDGEMHWWKPGQTKVQTWSKVFNGSSEISMSAEDLEIRLKRGMSLEMVIKEIKTMVPDTGPLTINSESLVLAV